MITTQSTVQNTASKRRESVPKNVYEHLVLKLPEAPATFSPKVIDTPPLWKATLGRIVPASLRRYLPEVDVKVTLICLVWYVTSSVSSNLSKAILREFPHPVGLTELQFLTNGLMCLGFLILVNYLHRPSWKATWVSQNMRNFPDGILPPYLNGSFRECIQQRFLVVDRRAVIATLPMGMFQFMGHFTSYKATSLIPVSLVHSVKSLSPIMTLCWYRFAKKKQFHRVTYYTVVPLVAGVILTSSSSGSSKSMGARSQELRLVLGLFFAAVSMAIFVSQNLFAKSILTVKKRELLPSQKSVSEHGGLSQLQLDKITILFYCSCIGFSFMLPVFLVGELFAASSVFADISLHVLCLMGVYVFTHFLQAMLAFQLIGMLSSVNYSIASIMKRVVVIGVALTWESQLSGRQLLGLVMTVIGLYGYDKWGNKTQPYPS
ncbi:AaceriAFR543Cp [[Ashbya] aceris (nom. inval.)]|nr:AaceriAFR543Cp [[Ashbya] aceris (nom. inval.)]